MFFLILFYPFEIQYPRSLQTQLLSFYHIMNFSVFSLCWNIEVIEFLNVSYSENTIKYHEISKFLRKPFLQMFIILKLFELKRVLKQHDYMWQ